MTHQFIPGYDPDTDTVETDTMAMWHRDITLVRITRPVPGGRLKVVMPNTTLVDAWPEEFLWRPLKVLGVLDVWWSLFRSVDLYGSMEVHYETPEGGGSWRQLVSREMVQDAVAWQAAQAHLFERFILEWQREINQKEAGREFSASE